MIKRQRSRTSFESVLTCRIQTPDTLRAGRIGAAHGGAARWGGEVGRGWVGWDAVSIRPGDYPPSFPPANRRHCPGHLFESTNKRNPM